MDPLSLLVGAALLAVGGLLGRVTRRPRTASPRYVCECRHSRSFHDAGDGPCQRLTGIDRDVRCQCRGYVGPLPPLELSPDDVLRALGSDRPTEER